MEGSTSHFYKKCLPWETAESSLRGGSILDWTNKGKFYYQEDPLCSRWGWAIAEFSILFHL